MGSAASREQMTWDQAGKRWVKFWDGVKYRVGCKALGCPPTRSGSRDAANAWWRAKKVQLDVAKRESCLPQYDELFSAFDSALQSIRGRYDGSPLDGNAAHRYRMFRAMRDALIAARDAGKEIPPIGQPPLELELQPYADEPWNEPSKPAGDAIEEYLRLRQQDVDNGDLSPGRYSPLSGHLRAFGDWLKTHRRTVETLDGGVWDAWGRACRELVASGKYSAAYARDRFRSAKQLIKWAAATGRLPALPINLDAVRPKPVTTGDVATIPLDELRGILDAAPERLKLWLLLMLNTGGTQQDIADMRADELEEGAIVRARSKTRKHGLDPRRYPLWPESLRLLKKYLAKSGDRLLVNENGAPLVTTAIVGGKLKKSDAIKSAYHRLGAKLDRTLPPLKLLRATGSSLIADVADRDVAEWYLCHAGRSVADRHYIKLANERLDAALTQLGALLLR